MKAVSLNDLTLTKFSGLLNGSFCVRPDPSTRVRLKLIAATPKGSSADAGTPESFSLVFMGPLDRCLPQQMYSFEHDQLGTFDLFIVPIGRDAEGFQYEAIFNRDRARTRT